MSASFVFDKAAILEQMGGDEELLVSVAEAFALESEDYCRNLDAAQQTGNAGDLRREAHTIKSLLATFGDEAGREQAFAVEQAARAGDMAGIESDVEALKARLRLVIATLRQELGLA